MNHSGKQLLAIIGGVLIFIFLFALCNPFKREIFLLEDPQVDKFVQNEAASKVDLLWVIDNSGSMERSQANLAQNFRRFIGRFVNEQTDELIDFQMAVVTTDLLQEDGRFVQGRVLNRAAAQADREQFVRDFQELVQVGTGGLGLECCLLPAIRATEQAGQGSFFRQDALLVVNLVSDEADMSVHFRQLLDRYLRNERDADIPGRDYESFVAQAPAQGLKPPPAHLEDLSVEELVETLKRFKAGRRVMINSIVSMRDGGMSSRGEPQMRASRLTNGIIADIEGDFAELLSDMGGRIYRLAHSFALSRKPDGTDRMLVFVNGEEVTDWTYNPTYQSIEFINGYLPPPGAEIEVQYEVFFQYEEGE